MRVVATATGYDNVTLRQPGEEFDMPEGSKAPWFKEVEAEEKPRNKPGPKPKDPKD